MHKFIYVGMFVIDVIHTFSNNIHPLLMEKSPIRSWMNDIHPSMCEIHNRWKHVIHRWMKDFHFYIMEPCMHS